MAANRFAAAFPRPVGGGDTLQPRPGQQQEAQRRLNGDGERSLVLIRACARTCSYSERLNSGMAMAIMPTANTVRMTRSCQMATKPASFNNSALNPCTA